MATSDILGLFVSPEQYQAQQLAQQQAAEQQRAFNFAGLDPRQQAIYGTFLGSQQLGRGFGGLLGVQDPQLQRIRQREEIMRSINPADMSSLTAGIQRASEMGDQELALSLTDFMNKQGSEMAQAQQRIAAATRERQQAVPADIAVARELAGLKANLVALKATPPTPERDNMISMIETQVSALEKTGKTPDQIKELAIADEIVKLEDTLRTSAPESTIYKNAKIKLDVLRGTKKDQQPIKELVLADSIVGLRKQIREAKDPADPAVLEAKDRLAVLEQQLKKDKPNLTVVGEVKSGPDKGKAVYVDENNDQQFVYDVDKTGKQVRKPFVGDVDRITSQVTATASSSTAPGVKAFQEKLGALDAKDVESARANRDNSIAALNTLNELSRLNQQGVTSGAFADGRIGAVNLLNTLGLVSRNDATTLANSQTFNKVAGDLVLATLGGKLGAGFSNEDRKFIAGLVPQLEISREARQKLISFMMKKNQLIIDEADRLENYARENNGLKGFRPKIPIINAPAPGTVQAMTDAELKAAIEKAKQKGK